MRNLFVIPLVLFAASCQDEGCTYYRPVLCSKNRTTGAKICKKSIEECDAFDGCNNPGAPYLCPDGECSQGFHNCKNKYDACDGLE